MENNNKISTKEEEMTGKDKNCCRHHYGDFWFIKILGGILIIIFLIAVIAGVSHWGRFNYERQSVFDHGGYMMNGHYNFPLGRGFSMMGRNWSDSQEYGYNRLFGTITKIEDNKISITDNANKEQTLVTQTNTLIVSKSASAI